LKVLWEATLPKVKIVWVMLILTVVPIAIASAQSADWSPFVGVWWKDCELDARYDHAYDKDHSYGKKSILGGWKIDEVRKLAESGDACMQHLVGRYYDPGAGPLMTATDADPSQDRPENFLPRKKEAAKWFRLAAEQGHAEAQAALAGLYWYGYGVRQDYVEAAAWHIKAANQGLSCSQLELGEMYQKGQGVRKDYVQGHFWMNLASAYEQGGGLNCSQDAPGYRNTIAAQMTPSQIDEAQLLAREWKRHVSPDPIGKRTYKTR
jgi:hypothetical protein